MIKPNLSGEVIIPWGEGDNLFALKGKQLETLEKVCDAGISEIAHRVMSLSPKYADLYYVIMLGLEGGGMPSVDAKKMMDRYFDGAPLANPSDPYSPVLTAAKIMQAAWFGMEDIERDTPSDGEGEPADTSKKKE